MSDPVQEARQKLYAALVEQEGLSPEDAEAVILELEQLQVRAVVQGRPQQMQHAVFDLQPTTSDYFDGRQRTTGPASASLPSSQDRPSASRFARLVRAGVSLRRVGERLVGLAAHRVRRWGGW